MKTRYVAGFLFTGRYTKYWKQVLLIKKNRPEWQAGLWNGIGGHVEDNELPVDAMRREFKEEAGVDIDDWENFCTLGGKDFEVDFFRSFKDKEIADDIQKMTDEELAWWHIEKLGSVITNLHWLIPMAFHVEIGKEAPYYILCNEVPYKEE